MSRGISPRFPSCFHHGEHPSQVFEGADVGRSLCQSFVALFEMGYHATGAVLLAAIEKKRGLPGVMNVMADPRRLLTAYNDCDSGSTLPFSFDPALAEQVAHLGESKSK